MSGKKEQKIIVLTSLSEDDRHLILYGSILALQFKKELCLAFLLNRKNRNNKSNIKIQLNAHLQPLKEKNPSLKTSVLLLEESRVNLPELLADDYEAILLVARAKDYKQYSSAVTRSPIPFLFTNMAASFSGIKKIIMPLDLRKENSDALLWGSWFGRFCNSVITLVAANDKDGDSKRQVHQNVMLSKKLFEKTGVLFKIIKGTRSSLFNSFEATDFAMNEDADLLIILGSSTITPLDWLIGLPERKIIKKAGKMSVLLVNPRRDNYILCD